MPILVLLMIRACAVAAPLSADGPLKPVNADASGLALKGYDPVAYFVDGTPVQGSLRFEPAWNGATWRLASAANRDRLAQAPETYAPQFGGYRAWAVSRNYTADTDPAAFDIVNGKLYLNYSKLVQLRWKTWREHNIRESEQNWHGLLR